MRTPPTKNARIDPLPISSTMIQTSNDSDASLSSSNHQIVVASAVSNVSIIIK